MLLTVQHGVRDLTELIFKVLFQDNTLEKVLLGPLHLGVEDLLSVLVWESEYVVAVELGGLADELRLAEPG